MVGLDSGVAQAIQPVTGGGIGFFKLLSYSFLSIFIFLLLVNTLYIAVEQKSIYPVLVNLGQTFLLSTQHLSETSKEIVANGGGYVATDNFWTGVWNYLCLYGSLYVNLYVIYCWLKLLTLLFGYSPFSNDSNKFINFSMALITFVVLQSFILLGNAAVTKTVDCFNGCENSVISYMTTPITWIVDFVKAIPLIIKPASYISHTVVGNATIY